MGRVPAPAAAAPGGQTQPAPPRTSPKKSLWQRVRGDWFHPTRLQDVLSFQVSLVTHCLLMVVLALMVRHPHKPQAIGLVVSPTVLDEAPALLELTESPTLIQQLPSIPEVAAEVSEVSKIELSSLSGRQASGAQATKPAEMLDQISLTEMLTPSEAPLGGGVEGRKHAERARLVQARGGSAESEDAVELGLAWLAAHQNEDGGWWLDHTQGACDGRCRNPSVNLESAIGATGLALLPFFGAGYTHDQGKYQGVVQAGLDFLMASQQETAQGGDLHWDTTVGMYSQGIATLALCEAYAMTGDEEIRPYAQKAVDFICNAQHAGGGWRYNPGEPGDTTVTGWQIMALKSAKMAQLSVPYEVLERTKLYLNSVQDGSGAFYGYVEADKKSGPTAVGLLLRMYLGWHRNDERLQRGVNYLAYLGPSKSDMYFNYYATQVLHHHDGNPWPKWNQKMRDYLIDRQMQRGHEKGSWFFPDPHGSVGGRLYTTAICTMILEVYYRYLPLYGERAVE